MTFPAKILRARAIARHVRAAGLHGVVCFTCGNAAAALRAEGLNVIEAGPGPDADHRPRRWWTATEIAARWPGRFDATSGHLPMPLMVEIAAGFRAALGPLRLPAYEVPTGSGETVVCLSLAYPSTRFVAAYGDDPATRYEPSAPLNGLVARLCEIRRSHASGTA